MALGGPLRRLRAAIALAAAYALALQALVVAVGSAADAGGGRPAICAPAAGGTDRPGLPSPGRPDGPACCVLACPAKGSAAAGPAVAARAEPDLAMAEAPPLPAARPERVGAPALPALGARGPPTAA